MSTGKITAVGLLLFVLAAGVFLPAIRHEFVNLDDDIYVYANAHVQQGLSWENLRWAGTTLHGDFWHPLTWVSHMADCQLYGLRPWGHHLTSVLFHAASALLLFLALCRMTGALWRSALVAGLFAVHPLHVESVAWVSDRKDVLGAFFWMLTLLAYAAYVKAEGKAQNAEPSNTLRGSLFRCHVSGPYLFCLGCFACALMSKSTAMTLPVILLLLDWWPLGRMKNVECRMQNPASGTTLPSSLRRRPSFFILRSSFCILEKLPFLALALAAGLIAVWGGRTAGVVGATSSFPIAHRIYNAVVSYPAYVFQTIWPAKLAVFYPYPTAFPLWPAAGAVLAGAVITVVVWASRRRPYLLVGWLWYLVALFPMIGLIQVGGQARADRYTYIPLIGLFIMLAWGLGELHRERRASASSASTGSGIKRPKGATAQSRLKTGAPGMVGLWLAPTLGALALAGCIAVTSRQLAYWHDSATLYRHALKVTRGNHVAYDNLGLYLWNEGRTDEAIENYRKSLAIVSKFQPLNNLGLALASQGKYAEAAVQYEAALQLRPDEVAPRKGLAEALARSGKLDEAVAQYQQVLRSAPNDLPTHNNLGIILMMQGKQKEAIAQFREALRIDPSQAGTHANLAYALAAQHKLPEASGEYREVLRLTPDDARAHRGLGSTLAEEGKLDEAVKEFTVALRLSPDDPVLRYQFGLALKHQGRHEQAVAQYTEALRLKPDYADAQRELQSLSAGPKP